MMLSIAQIVSSVLSFYSTLIIIYVLMSWFPARGLVLEVYRVLASVCEPYVGLFRRIMPVAAAGGTGIDFSPLVAILVLSFIRSYLVPLLAGL